MIEYSNVWHGVTISYPRQNPDEAHVRIELSDVRAAKGIRVSYDFERDGWLIEMEQTQDADGSYIAVDDEGNELSGESLWKEAAFVHAWTFHKEAI